MFAPTSSVGQIQAYDRDNSQWNDFIIKGQTIQVHANGSERLRIDNLLGGWVWEPRLRQTTVAMAEH